MPSLAVMASGRKVLWIAWKGFQETNVEPDEATTKLIIDQVSTSYGKKPMEDWKGGVTESNSLSCARWPQKRPEA
jgi:hypothetical protein